MSADGPLVSVVTASFNAVAGLRETVASVAAQTFASREHVVADGGSGDGTRDFLDRQGDDLRWFSEPDRGIADALNKGIASARGEWVLVLQAEDLFVDPHSLAHAAEFLTREADIVSCDVLVIEPDGTSRRLASGGMGLRARFQMSMPHQGVFCRRALFDRLGGFDESFRIAMDYDFLLRARRHGAKFRKVNRCFTIMPATGISSRRDWAAVEERLAEFRRAQESNCSGAIERLAREIYWRLYLPFKKWRVRRGAS